MTQTISFELGDFGEDTQPVRVLNFTKEQVIDSFYKANKDDLRGVELDRLLGLEASDILLLIDLLEAYVKQRDFGKGEQGLIFKLWSESPAKYVKLAKSLTGTQKIDGQGNYLNIRMDFQANSVIERVIYYLSDCLCPNYTEQ